MAQRSIKVWDLLSNIWTSDTISINGMRHPELLGLSSQGLFATLHLQSIDDATIVVTIQDLNCVIHDISDVSGQQYDRKVSTRDIVYYFALPHTSAWSMQVDTTIFPIDEKNMIIDISEMIYQAVALQTPFVKRTDQEQLNSDDHFVDNFDDIDDQYMGWTVQFRFASKD